MKTASWSLALVAAAGSAIATEEDCTDSSAPAYAASSYADSYGSSSAPSSAAAYSSSVPVIPASKSYAAGSASGPVIVTHTNTKTKTVCPCADGATPTRTPGEVYVTEIETEYTTICPGTGHEATYSWGDWTSIYTSYEVTTTTDTITTTLTEPYPVSSGPGGYSSGTGGYPSGSSAEPVSSSAWGYPSGSAPAGYPSGSSAEPVSSSAYGYPSGSASAGYPSGSAPAGYSSSSGDGHFPSSPVSSSGYSSSSGHGHFPSSPASSSGYSSSSGHGHFPSSPASSSGYSSSSGHGHFPSSPASSSGYSSSSGHGHFPSSPVSSSGYQSGSSAPYPSGSASGYPGGYPTGYPSGYQTGYSSSYSSYAPTGTSPASPTGTSCIPCDGQPGNDPEKWCGYDIHDNWYDVVPKTCKTVEYYWTITEETVSPDGVARTAFLVNGQLPGPMIEANWGDTVIVHLTNQIPIAALNGTSLHFHGIRQNGTNEMDGTSSITQCPIAPGSSMTYKWTANSYGSSWWHSHYALQTYEGVFGPMVIHGPAAEDYDDEQMIMLQDWNHATVDSLYLPSQFVGNPNSGPQTLDTGLINGMNVWEGAGQQFEMTVEPGKSYRLRLVNVAIQSTFVFYVDGHSFDVIAMDFVPITPYNTDKVVINIGQRYDLIMKADQSAGDYWMRSENQQTCGNLTNPDIRGIVHYSNGPKGVPVDTPGFQYPPTCLDEPYEKLKPIVPWSAGASSVSLDKDVAIGPWSKNPNLFKWTLSGTSFFANWDNPTLKSIVDDGTIPDDSGNLAISVPNLGEWVYVIIETKIPLPHPIHLHGHDFLILAQGLGVYNEGVALNLDNPPRRDVAVMPADVTTTPPSPGYLVVAFYTSNPGVWLMHCHIGWVS